MQPQTDNKRIDLRTLYGPDYYRRIGRLGGAAAKRRRQDAGTIFDRQHFVNIGKKGGEVTKQRGADYYRAIGKKGRDARNSNKEAKRRQSSTTT